MKISMIIPVYNGEEYIWQALESIEQQTKLPDELIVIDDKSIDESLSIIKGFEEKTNLNIKIIALEKNEGVSRARNTGIENSTGDWLLFLDADDMLMPDSIDRASRLIEKLNYKDTSLIYSAYLQVNEKGDNLSVIKGFRMDRGEAFAQTLIRNRLISPSGVFVNREKLWKSGGFKEGLKHQVEDVALWLEMGKIGNFEYNDEPWVKIRRHDTNATASMKKSDSAGREILKLYDLREIKEAVVREGDIESLANYIDILLRLGMREEVFFEIEKSQNSDDNHMIFLNGIRSYFKGELKEAREFFLKALEENSNNAILNNLGVAEFLLGEEDRGIKYFTEALKSQPNYLDAMKNLKNAELKALSKDNAKITMRFLRDELLTYKE